MNLLINGEEWTQHGIYQCENDSYDIYCNVASCNIISQADGERNKKKVISEDHCIYHAPYIKCPI